MPPTKTFPPTPAAPASAVRCVAFTSVGRHPRLVSVTTNSERRGIRSAQAVLSQLKPFEVWTCAPAGLVRISRTSLEPRVTVAHPERIAVPRQIPRLAQACVFPWRCPHILWYVLCNDTESVGETSK